jgi:hypothetical protein
MAIIGFHPLRARTGHEHRFPKISRSERQFFIIVPDIYLIQVIFMDKMGIGALIAGIILILAGICGIWIFLPDVITVVKGAVGILVLIIGILLAVFGILMVRE